MKNLKRFAAIIGLSALFAVIYITPSKAQTRVVSGGSVIEGNTLDFGGVYGSPSDSLQVSDSIAYLISVVHYHAVDPYLTWFWHKIGTGNPTVTLSFLQSNDNVNWFAVPKGAALSAYTKTFSPTADTWYNVSFAQDTARFEGKYLKVYYITSSTASTKGKIFNRLKTIIK